ncbi:methylase involved in ubiquinone/menaquinone biosynthesis [Singulisphaera acidiphila DSM 18658]|uniref:Methylase involved in ubiquinone/menaquinone biosynthesis n=2 Tax=Singulisphaera acidiphila TaxID=466153 RepID=L0DT97_SINAD|nr:methylase involved in ubiquinone/menaquinone biosynthesis [Singulisphaera acidiphila DSM 18658]
MDVTFPIKFLRCIQDHPARDSCCSGALIPTDNAFACDLCNFRYSLVRGIPVFRPDRWQITDSWFEEMYAGRSRIDELETPYLRDERRFMAAFAEQRSLEGPCLEIGCGTGLFAETVPQYIGLEYALESLFAQGFEPFTRLCGDARRLPLADSSMECVFSFNTLEHVPELERAFEEIDRVLKPGGMLVLKPAWHCTKYTTELIPVLPYRELKTRQKVTKALLPIIRSKLYKLLTWTPWRIQRRLMQRPNNPLHWGRLTPYHGKAWISDADATSSIDCHEGILYFTSRGYVCHSHPTAFRQLLAGHDVVVLEKPAGNGN